MSDYKKIIGFEKSKKVVKKETKPKVNEVLKSLQEEFGKVNEIAPALARVGMAVAQAAGQGFGQSVGDKVSDKLMGQKGDDEEEIEEGPAYEYKKDIKNIDKSYKLHAKSVLNFYEKLRKKGFDKEASDLLDTYKKNYVTFKKQYDKIVSKLM